MKRFFIVLTTLLVIYSCNKQNPHEQVNNLAGYWEINKVEFSRDSIREYRFNQVIDFFEIENMKGFRKKVRPQLDGTFTVTNDEEAVEAHIEDDQLYLLYTTPYHTWRERVITAKENELVIENEDNIIYHYQRFTPLLENYEEEQ